MSPSSSPTPPFPIPEVDSSVGSCTEATLSLASSSGSSSSGSGSAAAVTPRSMSMPCMGRGMKHSQIPSKRSASALTHQQSDLLFAEVVKFTTDFLLCSTNLRKHRHRRQNQKDGPARHTRPSRRSVEQQDDGIELDEEDTLRRDYELARV